MTSVNADRPAHLHGQSNQGLHCLQTESCSKVTSVDPVNAQADLSVPCSHVIRSVSIWRASNDFGASLDSDEHIYVHVKYGEWNIINPVQTLIGLYCLAAREY